MGVNKNAKLIPLAVLGLGLVAAVGMYLRLEKVGRKYGNTPHEVTVPASPLLYSPRFANGSIQLLWTSSPGASFYKVMRILEKEDDFTELMPSGGITVTSFLDQGVSSHQYRYEIVACDAHNICSQPSNVQEIGIGWNGVFPGPRPVPDPLTASWLSALNASYDGSINGDTVEWFATPSEIHQWSEQGGSLRGMDDWTATTMLSTTILNSATSSDTGAEQYILTQTRDITCGSRPCNAVLGGAVIANENGQWKVLELQKYVDMGGNSGMFSQAPTTIKIGISHEAFLLHDKNNTGPGYVGGVDTIYALVDGVFRKVLEKAFGSTLGSRDVTQYDAENTLEPLQSAKEFYDIKLTSTETRYSQTRLNKITDTPILKITGITRSINVYSFDGNVYVPKSGKDASTNLQK